MMVTMDEIRQRIEQADNARLQARIEAAAIVATVVGQRTRLRAELDGLEVSAAAQIEAAGAVMTVDELAKFTGIPLTELRVNGGGNGKVVPVRKTRAARAPKVQPTATAPIREDAPQDVTA